MNVNIVKLEIYVPEDYVPRLVEKLGMEGIGKVGEYDHCFGISKVTGCWRPLEDSNPYRGIKGELCYGEEVKLETRCSVELLDVALEILMEIHPYEKPLINVIPLLSSKIKNVLEKAKHEHHRSGAFGLRRLFLENRIFLQTAERKWQSDASGP